MQKVRGFLYFEGKSYDEVIDSFKDYKFSSASFGYFKELNRYDNPISIPGIFITGNIEEGQESSIVIKKFRSNMGLDDKFGGCDLSIEDDQDILEEIKLSELKGNYIGIRILPSYDFKEIYNLSKELGSIIDAKGIYVRTVESIDNDKKVCIELITDNNYSDYRSKIEEKIKSNNLELGKYTFIKLE
jgi:hypothetical protein